MVTLTLVKDGGLLMFNQSLQCDSPCIKWRWGRTLQEWGRGLDNVKVKMGEETEGCQSEDGRGDQTMSKRRCGKGNIGEMDT